MGHSDKLHYSVLKNKLAVTRYSLKYTLLHVRNQTDVAAYCKTATDIL